MPDINLKYAIGLAPQDAIKYFKSKGGKFSWDWWETWQEAHTKAFTVAKVMKADILQDIRSAVQKALDDGITYNQFQKELMPQLKAHGWWGKVMAQDVPGFDPASGVDPEKIVQLGSPWRLKTIYRTNMQSNYMAGRYKGMAENVTARPYWQYVAVMDARTRPSHAELNGRIFAHDDPFWDSFYPPNGWGCRCRVRPLSPRNLEQRKLTVEKSTGKLGEKNVLVSKEHGLEEKVATFRAGKTRISPDPGFSYNPGKTAWQPNLKKYSPEIKKLLQPETFFNIADKKLHKAVNAAIEESDDSVKDIYRAWANKINFTSTDKKSRFRSKGNILNINKNDLKNAKIRNIFPHEFGHAVDVKNPEDAVAVASSLKKHKSMTKEFSSILNQEAFAVVKEATNIKRLNNLLLHDFATEADLSDLFSSLTINNIEGFYGHKLDYLMKKGKRESEVFADLFSIYSRRDKTIWNVVKKELPQLAKAFEKIITGL